MLAAGLGAQATNRDRRPQTADRGPQAARLEVYLITIGQGAAYWEKYGHNMLVFFDAASKTDVAYNWGTFDFAAPNFLKRQLVGDPQYSVEGIPTQRVVDFYTSYNRTITLQKLNLTVAQATKALEFSRWNARPENKFYRYDYFRDNCSTRVRDVIDTALGGALRAATTGKTTTQTYRSETVRLVDAMKFIQLGVAVALGRPADRPLSVWEAGFIPMRLRDAIRDVRVAGPNGEPVPLVADERVVFKSTVYEDRADVPVLWPMYLILGLLIGAELLAMGLIAERTPKLESVFRLEASTWAFVTGLLGLVLLLAWVATQHAFWYRNENLLLVNPLSLFVVVLLPMSLRNPRWTRPAAVTSVLIALIGAVALLLKGVPGSENNLALIALVLPAHFAVAFGLWRRSAIIPARA